MDIAPVVNQSAQTDVKSTLSLVYHVFSILGETKVKLSPEFGGDTVTITDFHDIDALALRLFAVQPPNTEA